MTIKDLQERLTAGEIVPLTTAQWEAQAPDFEVADTIETFMAGRILLVRRPVPGKKKPAWALVEDPEPGQKVIRPLATEKEARALIADRLAAYERMWDG
jgi:hypothetical protein